MSRNSALQALGLLVALFMTGSGAEAAEPSASSRPLLLFPIVVDAPAATSTTAVASGGDLYSQAFRSEAAVRLTAPYRVIDTSGRTIDFAEGAVFAMAAMPDDTVFCAPGSNGARGLLVKGDVGVCFRDADHDGVFDGQAVVGSTSRARSVYELNTRAWPGWSPAKAAYAPIRAEDIPAGRISIEYFYVDPPLRGPMASAKLRICAPEAMTAPIDEKWAWTRCGALLDRSGGKMHQDAVWLNLKAAGPQALLFGPVGVSVAVGADGLAATKVDKPFPAGRKLLMLAATYGHPGDPATQTSIFALLRAEVPSSGEARP